VAELVGEPVAAEHDPVARANLQFPHVGFDVSGNAEGAGEDVALRMHRRFLFGDLAVPHPLLGQAVIGRHLHDSIFGKEVGA